MNDNNTNENLPLVENYGQWMDLPRPETYKERLALKLLCVCPKCGKKHVRSYQDILKSKENMYCFTHKRERTLRRRYGENVTSTMRVPGAVEKMRKTCAEKYGEDYGQVWYDKMKKHLQETRGIDNVSQDPTHTMKCLNTLANHYGSIEMAWKICQRNREITAEQKYGSVEAYNKQRQENVVKSFREKYGDPEITGVGNLPTRLEKIFEQYLDDIQYFEDVRILFKNGEYVFKCLNCDYMEVVTPKHKLYRCPKCNGGVKPKGLCSAIAHFIKNLGVEIETDYNDPSTNYTFDIYIPANNIAINIISTATHSNLPKYENKNMVDKCEKYGIKLISLFEDLWYNYPDIAQSRIKTLLDKNTTVLNGLSGTVTPLPSDVYQEFMEENHPDGPGKVCKRLGLKINGILVAAVGIGSSEKYLEARWEIVRFCCKQDYTIENALHPFIMWCEHNLTGEAIVYYQDRRWPDDTGNAMEILKDTDPTAYFWKGDGDILPWYKFIYNHYDEDFENDLSYMNNMRKNGYNIMYNCGYRIFFYG